MNVLNYRHLLNEINEIIKFLRGKYLVRFDSMKDKESEGVFLEGTCT